MRRTRVLLPLLMGLIVLAGCEGCRSANDANTAAADTQKAAVVARLNQFAAAHPDQAGSARSIVDGWDARLERENYRLAAPMLEQLAVEKPDHAESIRRSLRTWRERLDRFEK